MKIDAPGRWEDLDVERWSGPILVFGGNNSGKTTFARYLLGRLRQRGSRVGYVDVDLGQSTVGPPTTVGLALSNEEVGGEEFPPAGPRRICFVGNNHPHGHLHRIFLHLHRFFLFLTKREVDTWVVDTSGLVDPHHAGADLKWGMVDLFRPCRVLALTDEDELSPILSPLRRLPDVHVQELPISSAVVERSQRQRRSYRADRYRDYFEPASTVPLQWSGLAVFPRPEFVPGQIVGLEGDRGFARALGIVERADDDVVWLRTPWHGDAEGIATLRLGELHIDEETFQDERI